jgi:hypothetical protein
VPGQHPSRADSSSNHPSSNIGLVVHNLTSSSNRKQRLVAEVVREAREHSMAQAQRMWWTRKRVGSCVHLALL